MRLKIFSCSGTSDWNLRTMPIANLPRCDYKEFLELAKIILGGSIDRKKGYSYKIQHPGADHHARWMSKSIYIMKMEFIGHQLKDLHWKTKKKVTKMYLFVFFAYLEAWFKAPSLETAASNDLQLFFRLLKFMIVHKVSSMTSAVLKGAGGSSSRFPRNRLFSCFW